MLLNRVNQTILIPLECALIIMSVFLVERFSGVGYAQETVTSLHENQIRNASFSYENGSSLSLRDVVCSQKRKSNCQSKPLGRERVDSEEIFHEVTSPYSLVKASLAQDQKEFLNIEIYVDRKHRNFEAEIVEIFNQSLVQQAWQEGRAIVLVCHCDDREPEAYSYILGHRWGKRAQAYLHNLSIHPSSVELVNYGNTYDICDSDWGDCQQGSRLQTTFRFLAIRDPHAGCLIQLKLPTQRNHRQVLFKEHPLFLQEIHVAGAWSGREQK